MADVTGGSGVDPAARDRCEEGLRRLAAIAEAERHFRDGSLSIAEFDAADEALDEAALSLRMNSYAWAVCAEVERLRAEIRRLRAENESLAAVNDDLVGAHNSANEMEQQLRHVIAERNAARAVVQERDEQIARVRAVCDEAVRRGQASLPDGVTLSGLAPLVPAGTILACLAGSDD